MFKNYVTVALRNILKHKFYSALNIVGLAFGLTACFLIGLYIYDEVSYDKFHADYQNIYSVGLHGKIGGQEIYTASSCPPLAQAMVSNIPGVEQAIRVDSWKNIVMKYEEKAFTESRVLLADSNFFEFFSFKLIEGDVKTALKEPATVVITTETARKYFGDSPAVGKIITVGNDNEAFKVTGIAEPAPTNSQVQYDFILSSASDSDLKSDGWTNNGLYSFYRKNPNTDVVGIDARLRELTIEHVGPEFEQGLGVDFKQFEKQGGVYAYFSYPMHSKHLYQTQLADGLTPSSDIKYVYSIGAVGIFILLIACINFMNLSTARSSGRAKEVGLRKTLGSVRSKLIAQFMSESLVYVFAAMLIAIVSVYLLLPSFNLLAGKALGFNLMLKPVVLLSVTVVFIIVALLAGSYPAFYLTSFNPVEVLKGKVRSGMKSKGIRSTLVVVQFAISITLIISTLVVYNQLNFLRERNIGLDKSGVIVIRNTSRLANNRTAFRESLNGQTGIIKTSFTNNVFPGVNNTTVFRAESAAQERIMATYYADYDHMNVLKMELASGRFFSKDFPSDSTACVINEAAVRELGWENPLTEKLISYNGPAPVSMQVVGVIKDFNFESFKANVRPLVIRLTNTANNMLVRYDNKPSDAVATLERVWKQHASNEPFEYTFLDQNFDTLFKEEQRLGQLFTVLTSVAIFVACLGLMGLASFTAEQRTKEIGIRKVMGASVSSVSALLSKEFMWLVSIAFVLASALAWYLMDQWLSSFAYRIELSAGLFVLGGALAAGVAALTVSFHFIKAARSNPVNSLRYE
ncbi:MAG TPA: ABC transporter permease [Cyclobacteriaceae bacterium]|nr:ABC transporter permease [Cyclobacteriaceae bacterium]